MADNCHRELPDGHMTSVYVKLLVKSGVRMGQAFTPFRQTVFLFLHGYLVGMSCKNGRFLTFSILWGRLRSEAMPI